MRSPVLRRHDVSLTPEHQELRGAFAALFEKESPSERVRASEPLGFDRELWSMLVATGALTMALPEGAGGDGGGLVEAALLAEQLGRRAAPVPLIEHVVASRVLARPETSRIATVALHPVAVGARQLVPAGAVADVVVGLEGDELVTFVADDPPAPVANLASAPVAWRTLSGKGVRSCWRAATRHGNAST
jgi:alkylation response protein AidB-like acyl-CoA dehydrogenase